MIVSLSSHLFVNLSNVREPGTLDYWDDFVFH